MIDLVDILCQKDNSFASWSKEKLGMIIEQASTFNYVWDKECGEGWASIFKDEIFIGYISSFMPLCFCKTCLVEEIKKVFGDTIIILGEMDFDDKKWFIDEYKLKKKMDNFNWIIQEGVLNVEAFSINDFWYATI